MGGEVNSPQKFEASTVLEVPAAKGFEWHTRPGAFLRLQPPWENVQVIGPPAEIRDGAEMTMRIGLGGPISKNWIARIQNVTPGYEFQDRQIRGPFAHWLHTHTISERSATSCELTDSVEYSLPLGKVGQLLGGRIVRQKLERMFAFRHQQTVSDLRTQSHYPQGRAMKIAITGSTGLVGSQLVPFLTTAGHEVYPIVRGESNRNDQISWNIEAQSIQKDKLEGLDGVIHLAGENIASGRWNEKRKKRIRDSRVEGTRLLSETLASLTNPPKVLICASAIGYYGDRGETLLDETAEPGNSFLADVCQEWEAAADAAREKGIRVVHLRLGVVLSPQGGALQKMLTPFKLGAGGKIGSGKQYWSWIELNDVIGSFYHALMTDSLSGPVNCVAPEPVTNREFTKTLGKVLNRPTIFPMPGFMAKLALGEMANELLLASTRVVPHRLQQTSYQFRHPELEVALRFCLGKRTS